MGQQRSTLAPLERIVMLLRTKSFLAKKTCGYIFGQISIIPKPELRGFGGSSLIKPPFRVTSADVVIICTDNIHIYIYKCDGRSPHPGCARPNRIQTLHLWLQIHGIPCLYIHLPEDRTNQYLTMHTEMLQVIVTQ